MGLPLWLVMLGKTTLRRLHLCLGGEMAGGCLNPWNLTVVVHGLVGVGNIGARARPCKESSSRSHVLGPVPRVCKEAARR